MPEIYFSILGLSWSVNHQYIKGISKRTTRSNLFGLFLITRIARNHIFFSFTGCSSFRTELLYQIWDQVFILFYLSLFRVFDCGR